MTTKFLTPLAVVGSSVSILFYFATFLVLLCHKQKNFLLRMKQYYGLTQCIANFIIVLGLKNFTENELCRFIVIIFQYIMISLFAWIAFDNYVLWLTLSKKCKDFLPVKVMFYVFAFPLPFLFISLMIGYLVEGTNLSLAYYNCWNSDHIIWLMIIPCVCLAAISMKFIISSNLYCNKKNKNDLQLASLRYFARTNIVMLVLQTMLWVCLVLTFWYPKEETFHSLFGVVTSLKSAITFFMYAITYVEMYKHNGYHDIQTEYYEDQNDDGAIKMDPLEHEVSNQNLKDVETEQTGRIEAVEFNGLGQQNNHHIHTPQKLTHDISPTTPQKDVVQPFETEASEGGPVKTTETPPPTPIEETVLVHHKPKNEDENQNHQDDEDSSTTNLVAMTTKDEDTFDSLKRGHGASVTSNSNINDTGSDAESKSVKSTNTDITDISVDKSNSTTPVRVEKGIEDEKPTQERPSPALSAGRENTFPSQTTISSKQETRPASRISNVSFTSQMGMNELESLFNNPDLLSQSNWKARSKSHASPNRMATETARQEVQQKKVETKTIIENKEDDSTEENKAKNNDTPSTKRSKKDSRNEFFDFN
ncbi:protein IWS1 homolog [Clytia hemisphaerica]|uniref:G-protein coupled receptors family 2 profile 2 domain-containing protein n=1 Tax=Clytia hemisphaerica TaxID=252671 RepID=A0A7M5U180_9CNID